MANIRIKNISTTAPSVANDDYLVIDGATNGTRKIKASKDVGGTMYDYTLNGGTALSASSSGYTRKLTVGDNSLITPGDILRMKIYGVSDTDGAVRINSYQCLYSSTDSLLVLWSQSTSKSFVFHIEAPFEITADSASM